MGGFERRIKMMEEELKTKQKDDSVWWEKFIQRDPDSAEDIDQFFAMHEDDPGFQEELKQGKFSDKTINEYADFYLKRIRERFEESVKHSKNARVINQEEVS